MVERLYSFAAESLSSGQYPEQVFVDLHTYHQFWKRYRAAVYWINGLLVPPKKARSKTAAVTGGKSRAQMYCRLGINHADPREKEWVDPGAVAAGSQP